MELRSSRSRSKTPFVALYETKNSNQQNGMYMEESLVRTTTRKTTTVKSSSAKNNRASIATSSSSKEILEPEQIKSAKEEFNRSYANNGSSSSTNNNANHKIHYLSLDYCSDEECSKDSSFNSSMSRSFKEAASSYLNQTIYGDGAPITALQLYREAGEYWNKYPKTDFTYSPSSRDRVEIAPGIVQMPNMARRSLIHTYYTDGVQSFNKYTNTSDSLSKDTVDYCYQRKNVGRTLRSQDYSSSNYGSGNNSYKNYYGASSSSSMYSSNIRNKTIVSRITTTIVTFWMTIYNSFLNVTESFTTRINRSWMSLSSDTRRWLSLLFVLLLFFTGLWLLSSFITGPIVPLFIQNSSQEDHFVVVPSKSTSDQSVSPMELTQDQLNAIAAIVQSNIKDSQSVDVDAIVSKVIESKNFQILMSDLKSDQVPPTVVNDNSEELLKLNNKLMLEISKVKSDILELERLRQQEFGTLIAQLRSENTANNARLSVELKRCCRSQIVYVESYVNKLLGDILAMPSGHKATPEEIRNWLRTLFVAKEDLEAKLNNATRHLHADFDSAITGSAKVLMDDISAKISAELSNQLRNIQISSDGGGGLSDERVKRIVRDALAIYDADKTGMVDYALESSGGQVLSTRCTESYQARTAVISVLGIPLWYPMNTPRTVISSRLTPGECWAFQNFPGFLVLKLSTRVRVTGFSLEHIPKSLMPNGKIESAPKDFAVFGLRSENDLDPLLLGEFKYDHDGSSLQHFAAAYDSDERFDMVEVRILSNHGNPNYTCIYRFRVHGTTNDLT